MGGRRLAARTRRMLARLVDTVSLPGSQPWVQPTEAQQGLAKVWFGGSHPRLLGAAVSAESAIDLNEPGLPVVALAGRSNVGKSSLLNAILEKKTRFNVSGTPGKTREVQLFGIGPATAATGILADLPGYGYARVSRDRRAALHSLITDYCFPDGAANPLLHRVFLLIDSKVGATDLDVDFAYMMEEAGLPYHLVITKADAPSATVLGETVASLRRVFTAPSFEMLVPQIQLVSADAGFGLHTLRSLMVQALQEGEDGPGYGKRTPEPEVAAKDPPPAPAAELASVPGPATAAPVWPPLMEGEYTYEYEFEEDEEPASPSSPSSSS